MEAIQKLNKIIFDTEYNVKGLGGIGEGQARGLCGFGPGFRS
jgi:hypothetical protein